MSRRHPRGVKWKLVQTALGRLSLLTPGAQEKGAGTVVVARPCTFGSSGCGDLSFSVKAVA